METSGAVLCTAESKAAFPAPTGGHLRDGRTALEVRRSGGGGKALPVKH